MAYCHLSGLANPALDLHIQFLSSPNQLSLKIKEMGDACFSRVVP